MSQGTKVIITKQYPVKGIKAGDVGTVEHDFADDEAEYARPFVNVTVNGEYCTVLRRDVRKL